MSLDFREIDFSLYLFGDSVEYLSPEYLDMNLASLKSLKKWSR